MLPATKAELIKIFHEIGSITARVTELKDAEREAWESDPEADPTDMNLMEEFEDILTGLPALFDEDEGESEG